MDRNDISTGDLHLHISRDTGIWYLKHIMLALDCAFTHSQLTQLHSIFMTGNHRFTIDEKRPEVVSQQADKGAIKCENSSKEDKWWVGMTEKGL